MRVAKEQRGERGGQLRRGKERIKGGTREKKQRTGGLKWESDNFMNSKQIKEKVRMHLLQITTNIAVSSAYPLRRSSEESTRKQ